MRAARLAANGLLSKKGRPVSGRLKLRGDYIIAATHPDNDAPGCGKESLRENADTLRKLPADLIGYPLIVPTCRVATLLFLSAVRRDTARPRAAKTDKFLRPVPREMLQ